MPAVRLRALSKTFREGFWRSRIQLALDRVSLDVPRGAVLGYLGPNGAGKTTTLRLLMQLVHPTAGSAEILGRPIGDPAVRRRVGYLPEAARFYDSCTAEELLMYFGGLFGYTAAERRRRTALQLDRAGIGAERRRRLRTYSRGMLQRVGIAQALLNDPEVVFLDEPMTGLDPLGRRDVRNLMLALRNEGRTVLISSHVLSDAEAVCSHVAILNRGRPGRRRAHRRAGSRRARLGARGGGGRRVAPRRLRDGGAARHPCRRRPLRDRPARRAASPSGSWPTCRNAAPASSRSIRSTKRSRTTFSGAWTKRRAEPSAAPRHD